MPLGQTIRGLLGPKLSRVVGGTYRSIFVDLKCVAEVLAPQFSDNAVVLDIGGGDGELLNKLLPLREDILVDMIDITDQLGGFIDTKFLNRVTRLPLTPLTEYMKLGKKVDCIMLNDVLHHIPLDFRNEFLTQMLTVLKSRGRIIIKEFSPGGLRSLMGLFADRYIGGDPNTHFISRIELESLVRKSLPIKSCSETVLFEKDPPNYALVFDLS